MGMLFQEHAEVVAPVIYLLLCKLSQQDFIVQSF